MGEEIWSFRNEEGKLARKIIKQQPSYRRFYFYQVQFIFSFRMNLRDELMSVA